MITGTEKKKLLIWGATGQSKVVWDILKDEYDLAALIDRQVTHTTLPAPIYRDYTSYKRFCQGSIYYIITVAGLYMGKERCKLHEFLFENGLKPVSAIHKSAVISDSAIIGESCQILMHSSVCTEASLGKCCIVNTNASVDHESILGNGVHICPGARVLGEVLIEDYVTVGAGAIIFPRIKIGQNTVIGAGSIVREDVPSNCVVAGNPGKIIKRI